ncbi:MAG: hypothetical protein ACKVIW_17200, partial [bacterium]
MPLHPVQEDLIEQSPRGQYGRSLRLKRKVRRFITPVVQIYASSIEELNIVQIAVYQDVRRAHQLPADDIESCCKGRA